MQALSNLPETGVVLIGRNEGERFIRALDSLTSLMTSCAIVYVDSGSTDNSVIEARSRGVTVVELDLTTPFTAARARNAGLFALLEQNQNIAYVQFIDGDCQLQPGWLPTALRHMTDNPSLAAVCGRRRELYPENSLYNRLIDQEWNTPVGKAKSCGGDALYRVAAFNSVGGFNSSVIAGEEPELCYRLREKGWEIERLNLDMTMHDANLHTFQEWWKRSERYGHAAMEAAYRYGLGPERFYVSNVKSFAVWGAFVPLIFMYLVLFAPLLSIGIIVVCGLQCHKLFRQHQQHFSTDIAGSCACLQMLCKVAECKGALKFWFNKVTGRHSRLIEYKTSEHKEPAQ